jgi:hypothetical protein
MGRSAPRRHPARRGPQPAHGAGRHVARPGEKSETPDVELEPEDMEARINKDRALWNKRAKALHDVSLEMLQAIEAKDRDKMLEVGDRLDKACENCI